MATTLIVIGLLLMLAGASVGASGITLSPKQAVEEAARRWRAETFEENLKQPDVQSLLLPSRLTSIGFGMIAVGTLFQIGGTLWQASAS